MAQVYRRKGKKLWGAMLRAASGSRMQVSLLSDRRASESMAANFERAVSLRSAGEPLTAELSRWVDALPPRLSKVAVKLGVITESQLERGRTLAELIVEWKASMLAKGCCEDHAIKQSNRVATLVAGCRFVVPLDVKAEPVNLWLASQRKGEGRESPLSASSSNAYLTALRTFTGWLVGRGILATEPTAGMGKLNAAAAKTRTRRALNEGEIVSLLAATEQGQKSYGVPATDRALLYRVAIETGLRVNELRTLTRARFDLGKSPSVTVAAANAKNGRECRLPLNADTAKRVQAHVATMLPGARVFTVPNRTAEMLAGDLVSAGIERENEAGVVDFHSLRVTFITRMARAGVPMATAQRLARHSTPVLTFGVYTRLGAEDDEQAIAALSSLEPVPVETAEAMLATGTEGQILGQQQGQQLVLTQGTLGYNHAESVVPAEQGNTRVCEGESPANPSDAMVSTEADLKESRKHEAGSGGRGGNRTRNLEIMSPLL